MPRTTAKVAAAARDLRSCEFAPKHPVNPPLRPSLK
jgi:hypothetical protein